MSYSGRVSAIRLVRCISIHTRYKTYDRRTNLRQCQEYPLSRSCIRVVYYVDRASNQHTADVRVSKDLFKTIHTYKSAHLRYTPLFSRVECVVVERN